MIHRVARWSGGVAAAVVLAAAGVGTGTPSLMVAAAVPLTYVAYGALATAPAVDRTVETSRAVEPTTAPPGRPVAVTLTVRNSGDRLLPDVRVVDGVPESLRVLDGSPRAVATLRPGESLTVSYRVLAKRGTYSFEPPRVRARSLAASVVSTAAVAPAGDDGLVCRLDADAPPLADTASGYAGQLATDRPGEGLEFHSTREYVPGDPTDRIDWHHYAKRDELATINFRERRSADVVLVVDARPPARVVAGPGHPSGVELSAYAATRALAELLRAGHDVGVALLGVPEPAAWLPPGGGREHRGRAAATIRRAADAAEKAARATAATGRAADRVGADGGGSPGTAPESAAPGRTPDPSVAARRIADRTPPGAQVVVFSPLLDDGPVDALDVWAARGVGRAVVSPDVLADNTVSGQLVGVRRHLRLIRTMNAGSRTVDWRRGTPLALALEYALAADGRTP